MIAPRSGLSATLESEITLLIVSDDPDRVRASLIAMDRICDYPLVPADPLIIEDVYLDTAVRDLARQSWVLRVRREDRNTLFALKGPARRTEWGGIQRIEIEEPWSSDAPARIMDHLASCGTRIALPPVAAGNVSAVEALERCGFVILQRRQTRRDRRIILDPGKCDRVAELVLDRVRYRFSMQEIRHMEIEIEAKDPSGVSLARAAADCLLEIFGQEVRPWDYGKTATGRILETLLDKGELQRLVRPDNYLMPIVYALIESRIKR
jgi:hypothetical protein